MMLLTVYTCSQGKQLTFHKVFVDPEGHAKKRYLAKAAECKRYPIREHCKGKKAKEERLHHTPHKAHYDRMLARLASRVGKRMRRLRAATVEPVLVSPITYYGLRQISKKRQAGAAKVMCLAANGL